MNFQEWYERLPDWEKDLPILFFEDKYWTPREIYGEVISKSARSQALLNALKSAQIAPDEESLRELAKTRLLELLEKRPIDVALLSTEHPILTSDELKELIRLDIGFGREMIDNEIRWMLALLAKFG